MTALSSTSIDDLLDEVFGTRTDRQTAEQWRTPVLLAALAGSAWTAAQIQAAQLLTRLDPKLLVFLAQQRPRIAQVNATTQERTKAAILDAVEAETSPVEAVRALFIRMDEKRAPGLALQFAGGAWEHGGTREMTLQLVPARLWITQRDMRVRPSHVTLDGQCREPEEPFETAAGEQLRYPRDPEGALNEVINCRCLTAPLARGCNQKSGHLNTETKRTAYWKAANASLAVEESRMVRVIRATFRGQRNAILGALT